MGLLNRVVNLFTGRTGAKTTDNTRAETPTLTNRPTMRHMVYVIDGSKVYHISPYCAACQRTKKKVKAIRSDEARKRGLHLCGICEELRYR